MAAEPPAPKTHFTMMPAKPKGTLADYDAGNLPPPREPEETTVPTRTRGSRPPRRRPNAPKFAEQSTEELRRAVRVAEEIEAPGPDDTVQPIELTAVQHVLGDLFKRREEIEAAIRALKELYR